jgi:biopolymer transport protein ExbD
MNAIPRTVEPNVTPLIDVMLVLLIVFMLITPVSTRSIETALPKPPVGDDATPPRTPPRILVREDAVLLDGRPVGSLSELATNLRDLFAARADRTVFVRVEGRVFYGRAVEAMDTARGAGAERIGLLGVAAPRPAATDALHQRD